MQLKQFRGAASLFSQLVCLRRYHRRSHDELHFTSSHNRRPSTLALIKTLSFHHHRPAVAAVLSPHWQQQQQQNRFFLSLSSSSSSSWSTDEEEEEQQEQQQQQQQPVVHRRGRDLGSDRSKPIFTDLTPLLAELDAEKCTNGHVDPMRVATVLASLRESQEDISQKGAEGQQLLRHLAWLGGSAAPGDKSALKGFTVLISELAKFGRVEDCFAVLERMKAISLKPDEHVYTALIGSCVPARDRSRAMQVLDAFKEEGLHPDVVTYTLVLKANEGRTIGEVNQAMLILKQLKAAAVGERHCFCACIMNSLLSF